MAYTWSDERAGAGHLFFSKKEAVLVGMARDGRPAVIAHRGDSVRAPENTLAAIALAIEAGADMVEIDVGFSADGQLVVIHDDTLDRTTSGHGPVRALPSAALRELDAGSWFSPAFAGERLPLLAEVLDLVRGRLPINIEIKGESVAAEPREGAKGGIEALALEAVLSRGMLGEALFSSFHPLALWRLRRLAPRARLASLLHPPYHAGRSPAAIVGEVGAQDLHVADEQATPALAAACRAAGIPLRVYTVNDPARFRQLAGWGIDGVFTDDPRLLVRTATS